MLIPVSCACGYSTEVKEEHQGKRVRCPACQGVFVVKRIGEDDDTTGLPANQSSPPPLPSPVAPEPTMSSKDEEESKIWEYKVLTQKDKWFSGKFDPQLLEQALNSYARQGWRMRGMATASVPGFGGNRDELIFVLER